MVFWLLACVLVGKKMIFDMIFLAFCLGLDAFFVALSISLLSKNFKNVLVFSALAAFFQALMPYIGWFITYFFSVKYLNFIQDIDHILVFVVFIYLAYKLYKEPFDNHNLSVGFVKLLILSIATSIDALGAGLMIFSLNYSILESVAIIGFVTFIMCYFSFVFGGFFSRIKPIFLKVIGVILLVFLGVKTLITHLIEGI